MRATGARPITTDPATHDRTMAFLSHGPQVVSWAILDAARHDPVARRHLRQAGPGFRDMTRLARSPRPLWREILASNRDEVARALARRRATAAPRRLARASGAGSERRDEHEADARGGGAALRGARRRLQPGTGA